MESLQDIMRAIEGLAAAERAALLREFLRTASTQYRVEKLPAGYGGAPERTALSVEEYLEGELLSQVRHEYLAGEIYAMSGSTDTHNRIAGNIFAELHLHLRGKQCEPFMNNMKAHVRHRGEEWFYYPDVMVNCDPSGQQKLFCDTPMAIFEVLSPSTERTDRREKQLAYAMIPTLRTYILVAQEHRDVTLYRRIAGQADEGWSRELLPRDGQSVHLPELEFSMHLDAIYQRTGL